MYVHMSRFYRVARNGVGVGAGLDGPSVLGIMHVLAREGLVERAFLASEVRGRNDFEREMLPARCACGSLRRTQLRAACPVCHVHEGG